MSFFYDNLADVCARCSDLLQFLMFILIFAGLLLQSYKGIVGGDLSGIVRHILVSGLLVTIMPFYGPWMLATQSTLGNDLLVGLGVDPISMLNGVGDAFSEAPFDTGSAPEIVLGIFNPMTWIEYYIKVVIAWAMALVSMVMYVFFWIGFQIQIVALYLGSAAGPLFLGMLVFEQTRDTAVKYHIGMIGICFWPLGWGLGMLFGQAIIDSGPDLFDALLGPVSGVGQIATLLTMFTSTLPIILGILWMLITLFVAPKVVSKAVTTGAQIGMGMISGGMSMAGAGVQAASGAAMAAGGAALTATGAGAAVGVGMMAGGAGAMGGAASTASKAGS
ncbi:hypothetical protein [Prosthecobacter fusiformis]|nr:hypothetical protein [Prosthecobacter fusiformis]